MGRKNINSKERGVIIMDACEKLEKCGFVLKYGEELACKGFVNMYCKGEKQLVCKRKEYVAEHGTAPSDDMLPSGQMMAKRI